MKNSKQSNKNNSNNSNNKSNINLFQKNIKYVFTSIKINKKIFLKPISSNEKLNTTKNAKTFISNIILEKNKHNFNRSNYLLNLIIIFSLFILSYSKSFKLFPILSNKNSQIILNINMQGLHSILHSSFPNPDSVIINGEKIIFLLK